MTERTTIMATTAKPSLMFFVIVALLSLPVTTIAG
jgi:hypothetical protein